MSASIPFECATNATPREPLLGLFISLNFPELHELAEKMSKSRDKALPEPKEVPAGIEPVPMTSEMRSAVNRLVEALCSPLECRVLGDSLVREIIFRALLGEHGETLYALTQRSTHYARVSQAIIRIRADFKEPLSVPELAKNANLSLSAFHRAFKTVTGNSPLQYIKKLRLNKAKDLLIHKGLNVNQAATSVAYKSQSQFSREFKRYFGVNPSESVKLGYQAVTYD